MPPPRRPWADLLDTVSDDDDDDDHHHDTDGNHDRDHNHDRDKGGVVADAQAAVPSATDESMAVAVAATSKDADLVDLL